MSNKLRADKISFNNDDFIVEIEPKELLETIEPEPIEQEVEVEQDIEIQKAQQEAELILNRAQENAKSIILKANKEADLIVDEANKNVKIFEEKTLDETNSKAQAILEEAQQEASKILEEANLKKENLLKELEEKIELETQQAAREGYQAGHSDGLEKIKEELEEKISSFDTFCLSQFEVKNKILKTAGKDIFDIIVNISKKILLKEPDKETLAKIINNTIKLLEKKEDVNIILSEKYARLLFEVQKGKLEDDIEFNFEDFKQYEGFSVVYNPQLADDTIIVENLSERFDASLHAQLDVIIRDILKNSKNGYLDTKGYVNDETK